MSEQQKRTEATTGTGNTSLAVGIFICFLGALFYTYEYLLRIQPSVMVPQLMAQFNLTGQGLGILGGIYYWAYSPMQIGVGLLTDIYGPRKMLSMAVAVCAIGSLIFGMTDSIYIAALGRFLIGFGSAFAFVGVLKLAAIWLPAHWFAVCAGLATALGMVGALVGDIQLSVLVHSIGWRETIFWSTAVGFLLLPLIWFVVRDVHPGHTPSEERVTVREGFQGIIEIAKNPQMWYSGLIGCTMFLSLSVFGEQFGIDFLQNVHHFTHQQASFSNSMVFLGWLVGAPLFGYISDYFGSRRWPLLIGAVVSGVIVLGITYFPVNISGHLLFTAFGKEVLFIDFALFIFGVFSSAEIICFAVGRENCPDHMAGSAVSFINMLVMLGGAIFQPIFGFLLDVGWDGLKNAQGVPIFSVGDYRDALLIIPVCLLVGAVLCFFINDRVTEIHEG